MLEPHLAAPQSERRPHSPEESAGYEAVRDSWVEAPQLADRTGSDPPALPVSIRELPGERPPAAAAFADRMFERLAEGDYAGALLTAEALLRRSPRDADALDCAEMSRTELRRVYEARLGALDGVPSLATAPPDVVALAHDVFTEFLLERVDGQVSLYEIAFAPGLAPNHALRVLSELYLQGVITIAR